MNKVKLKIGLTTLMAGILIFILAGCNQNNNKNSANLNGKQVTTGQVLSSGITPDDHFRGGAEAKVVIVEYSDFQCPACGYYEPSVNEMAKNYGDKIKIIYRHYPLSYHQFAFEAAVAAEAAAEQGKFWEMHDRLFKDQESLSSENIQKIAKEIGLNMDKYAKDKAATKASDKVKSDQAKGEKDGVPGTPSFFLNEQRLDKPPQNLAEWQSLIDPKI